MDMLTSDRQLLIFLRIFSIPGNISISPSLLPFLSHTHTFLLVSFSTNRKTPWIELHCSEIIINRWFLNPIYKCRWKDAIC